MKEWTISTEGLVEKRELLPGVYLARSLVKVVEGYVLTSVLNTTETEIELIKPTVGVMEVDNPDQTQGSPTGMDKDRYEKVLRKLRMEHLNEEERKFLEAILLEGDEVGWTSVHFPFVTG